MKTPVLGTAYVSRSLNLAGQRCVNLFPEIVDTKEGKEVGTLFGTPGLDLLLTLGTSPVRGSRTIGSVLYAVAGNTCYSITTGYVATSLGTIGTSTGPVALADNGTYLLILDGTNGYTYNTSTLTFAQITDVDFPANPIACSYQDGFFLVFVSSSQVFYQSDINDPTSWNALNFSSADGQPGNIVSTIDNHRECWIFKITTTEVWVNAGQSGFSFSRLPGVFIQRGCQATYSPARVGQAIMWLGQDEQGGCVVNMAQGYQVQRISTHAIEFALSGYTSVSDAIGFAYEDQGHFFYVLTFPTGDATWVYDLTESLKLGIPVWHERAYFSNGVFSRHRANCYAFFNGRHVVGDYSNGKVYAFNLDTYTDAGDTRKWLRSWQAMPTGQHQEKPMRFDALNLVMQTGINVPPATNPQIALRWSDDGGHTWSNQKLTALGTNATGQTARRLKFQRLGQTRKTSGLNRIWELSGSDPCPAVLMGAEMDAEYI